MKMRSMGAELVYEHGRTDGHDAANSRFSQFWEKRLKTHGAMIPLLLYDFMVCGKLITRWQLYVCRAKGLVITVIKPGKWSWKL